MKKYMKRIIKFINIKKIKWYSFRKPSIGGKLVIAFTLFGLIVGYSSYVFHTIVETREYIYLWASTVSDRLYYYSGRGGSDSIMDILNKDGKNIRDVAEKLNNLSLQTNMVIGFNLFYLKKGGNKWRKIFIDSNNIFRSSDAETEKIGELEKMSNSKIHLSDFVSFITHDNLTVQIDISRKIDKNKYVLYFEIHKPGLISMIRENTIIYIIFGLILFIFSYVLANIFINLLIRPIEKLTEGTEAIASGNYGYRFNIRTMDEIGRVKDSFNSMCIQIESHLTEIERRMKHMAMMNEIDKAVLSSSSRSVLLEKVTKIVYSLFHCYYLAILKRNDTRNGFDLLIYYDKMGIFAVENSFVPDGKIDEVILTQRENIIQMKFTGEDGRTERIRNILGVNVGSVIIAPLNTFDGYFGALVMSRAGFDGFTGDEENSTRMLADQIGVALNSVGLLEEREKLFLGILTALTRSIDAKSGWTAGHSENVAQYSSKIGMRLNFPDEEMSTLTISAILHDIGKIAIPESILDKKGFLTDEEQEIIQRHPQAGAQIIKGIPMYEKILSGILCHHEYWDGTGYPSHLRGEAIPINGRIIAIADVYEAITENRPYHKALGKEEAIAFLKDQKGKLFDPNIVDVFISILKEE